MASILEGELAQTIADALLDAEIPFDIVVSRSTTADGPNQWTPGAAVTTTYACKGFVEDWSIEYIAAGMVQANDLRVVIFAATLAIAPEPGDTVTVRGKSYGVLTVSPDPAVATFVMQVRA